MRKILIIDNSPGMTGAFKVMQQIVWALRDEFQFFFAIPTSNKMGKQWLTEHGVGFVQINFLELSKNPKSAFYFPVLLYNSLRLLSFCRKKQIDIVHVNDLYNMTGVLLKMLRPSVKLIYHVRLLPSSYAGVLYRFWLKRISTRANVVVAVSRSVEQKVKQSVNTERIQLIYDFIPLPEMQNIVGHQLDQDKVRFLYLANFTPGKGHDTALRAFSQALKKYNNMQLTLAGDDFGKRKNKIYKKNLMKTFAHLIQTGHVRFTGPVTQVGQLLTTHDVLLNFSESESFSMTCYEAACFGLPVIATRCGGPEEIVIHGMTGYLVDLHDTRNMIAAMLDLAKDPEKRLSMEKTARGLMLKRIEEYDTVAQYRKLYNGQ